MNGSEKPTRTERRLVAVRNSGAERKFLRLPDVIAATGLAKATVYRMAQKGEFPSPIKLSVRTSAWIKSDVDAWCDRRLASQPHEAA
jgi:prophage regulatory protein